MQISNRTQLTINVAEWDEFKNIQLQVGCCKNKKVIDKSRGGKKISKKFLLNNFLQTLQNQLKFCPAMQRSGMHNCIKGFVLVHLGSFFITISGGSPWHYRYPSDENNINPNHYPRKFLRNISLGSIMKKLLIRLIKTQ